MIGLQIVATNFFFLGGNFGLGICQRIRTMNANVMCKILAANLKQWQKYTLLEILVWKMYLIICMKIICSNFTISTCSQFFCNTFTARAITSVVTVVAESLLLNFTFALYISCICQCGSALVMVHSQEVGFFFTQHLKPSGI